MRKPVGLTDPYIQSLKPLPPATPGGRYRRYEKPDAGDTRNMKIRVEGTVEAPTLRRAIGEPDTGFTLGRLTIWSRASVLHIQLPSKRVLRFPDADVVDGIRQDTWNIRSKKWHNKKWQDTTEFFGKFSCVVPLRSMTARCRKSNVNS